MNAATHEPTHHVELVMGTAVSIDIRDRGSFAARVDEVVAWLHHVDATFSTYRNDSEVSRFGVGELDADHLSREVQQVLARCIELADVTNGCFDAFVVPAPNGSMLDPSGYVKGWSIERAAQMLTAGGAANFCINAGGDVAVRGRPAPATRWRVGIRHPDEREMLALVLEVEGPLAVATSATYERGAHIIDPRTGAPTTHLASATVTGPDLGIADAYATATFVMGLDALAWIEDQPGYEAYLITHEGTTHWSSAFPIG
ncbi:MAG: ApbE family lipoprotein [Ilumatobacteraceae bacterium]|nr:ApbE family lipoprotein [Ilumatobacteraceae bacterium]